MATPTPRRTVIYAPTALRELDAIWRWNAEQYGASKASGYLAFLKQGINQLSTTYTLGRSIKLAPEWKYRLIRRKPKGHGHVVAYRVDDRFVRVLHIFHTAQDWQAGLNDE